MRSRLSGWLAQHWYPIAAGGIIVLAAAIRIGLARQGWPGTDSDDSTMALMAKHILTHGERPIFFYGQAYMGTIEAYLGALMFALLGVSSFALKCGLILLYAAFMVTMYLLLSQLFTRGWALCGLVLLSLSDDDMLYHQLEAYGGYLETLLFGALTLLLAVWLIRTHGDPTRRRWRSWAYLGWGVAAGLGIWSDPLVLPFVALSAFCLILTCWHEVRRWMGALALAGLLIGLAPWIAYIAQARSPGAATSFLQHGTQLQQAAPAPAPTASHVSQAALSPSITTIAYDHLLGTVVISVPNNLGATALCPLTLANAWPPQRWTSPGIQRCIALRGVWGGGFLALLVLALILEIRAFVSLRRRTAPERWSPKESASAARAGGRLAVLGAPAITVVLFAIGGASSFAPYQYSRYLIGLAIALPVVFATLWERAPTRFRFTPMLPRPRHFPRLALLASLALITVTLAVGTLATYGEIPSAQAYTQQQHVLIRWLIQHDDTRIYADYWTCIRTIFLSDEEIICSIVDGQFQPVPNRYPPYDAIVSAAPHPAYVFPLGSAQARAFTAYAAQRGWIYARATVNNQYIVFRLGSP